jgi:DNA-binding XRE family transcriptional regulator
MAVNLQDKLARLPGERRAKVDARAAELIAEEMTLRDLRRALERTQVRLARELGVKQETVSRLEERSDTLLFTLRGYVEAMRRAGSDRESPRVSLDGDKIGMGRRRF